MPNSLDKKNHLVIGLGGTGGKVIRALRKQVYQSLRSEEPDAVNLRYLYLDSDGALMEAGDPSWKTLGRSVQLPQQSQLLIAGSMGLAAVIDNVNDYPGVKPWIGDRDAWQGILQSMQGASVMGGQKRRLGRFLFANKVGDFNNAVGTLINDMTRGGQSAVTVHVCCGLAGGTGSGTVVDVVSQVRAAYPDAGTTILVYALLPERHPNANWAGPNYHANGYAALRELNALGVGAWRPHDISGRSLTTSTFGREADRLRFQDPFNVCYLFSDENAAGYKVDVAETLPEVVASFLFHKTVTAADVGASGLDTLQRQEDYQIGSQGLTGERDVEGGDETRTRRFATFGVKALSYPEEEILEYLAFSFAEQAALQLRFNNWSEAVGFADRPRNRSFDGDVRDADTQSRWRLSDAHLTLSEGILDDERTNKRWRPHSAEWAHARATYATLVQEEADKKQWADKLGLLFERRFSEQFRKQGVQTFFVERARIRKRHVQEIRALIERELFERWMSGDLALDEVSQLLGDLSRELEERHRALDPKLAQQRDIAETYLEKAKSDDVRWAKVGLMSSLVGKYEDILKSKASNLEQHYLARTTATALEFAKTLLGSLRDEVSALKAEVDAARSTLQQALDRFQAEAAARLVDAGMGDVQGQTVRFYEPDRVRELGDRLVKDEETQRGQTTQMRRALAALAGADPTFSRFNEHASLGALVDAFQRTGAENARTAHDNARQNGGSALLGVNILDRLQERFGSDDEGLRAYLSSIVNQAQTFGAFSGDEEAKAVPGRDQRFTTFTFIVPDVSEHGDFGQRLVAGLKAAVPAGIGAADIVESPVRQNEIVLLNVSSSLPARFLEQTTFLKGRYAQRLQTGGERAALEIHLEGDGAHLPKVFAPSAEEVASDGRPFLLLARALDLFDEREDASGQSTLVFEVVDEDDLPIDTVPLGRSLVEAERRLTPALAAAVQASVRARLADPAYDAPETRKALYGRVVDEAKAVREVARNGEYAEYAHAARQAKPLLRLA